MICYYVSKQVQKNLLTIYYYELIIIYLTCYVYTDQANLSSLHVLFSFLSIVYALLFFISHARWL